MPLSNVLTHSRNTKIYCSILRHIVEELPFLFKMKVLTYLSRAKPWFPYYLPKDSVK